MVIIALGEAFVAIGIGATGTGIGLGEIAAAILGLLVATSFWLAYSTSSRSVARNCSPTCEAPIASRSPATCTRTRTFR